MVKDWLDPPPKPRSRPIHQQADQAAKLDLLITTMTSLLEMQRAQTEAINSLAASNMALVDAMIEGAEDSDGEELSRTYLDGSPR